MKGVVTMANYNINTICVQGGYEPKKGESRVVPIVQSTTFKYETSQQICEGCQYCENDHQPDA